MSEIITNDGQEVPVNPTNFLGLEYETVLPEDGEALPGNVLLGDGEALPETVFAVGEVKARTLGEVMGAVREGELNDLGVGFLKALNVEGFNKLREDNPDWTPNFKGIRDFTLKILRGVNLEGADLTRCDFSGTDLSGANLKGAKLMGAECHNCTFRATNLEGAYLEGMVAIGAEFTKTNLKGADLRGAHLNGADFDGANVTNVKWDGCYKTGANFRDCVDENAVIPAVPTVTRGAGGISADMPADSGEDLDPGDILTRMDGPLSR
ncbi:MAG: pentapeptide repeat-containing protein [Candidatus Gracilibacteria bacterium]|jgi:hypothetical protein